jgi:acetyltransferase-like isoleucine patch superfamily enzyme
MKALRAIGIGKAIRFIWFGWYAWCMHIAIPPIRVALLRIAGAHIGKDTVILDVHFSNVYHYGFRTLRIGSRCFIGDEAMLDVRGGITLEDDVTISSRAIIVSHINVGYPNHPLQKKYPTSEAHVMLKHGSYVGTAAIILPGVVIGPESMVGAGAVVTKSVAQWTLVGGVPAKKIKKI